MNSRLKGYCRDKEIIEVLHQMKCLTSKQIQSLFFNFPTGKRKSQERLAKLCEKGKIKRHRYYAEEPFIYYHEKQNLQEHTLMTNWIYIWLQKSLKQWEIIHSFEYERNYKNILRCDGFCAVKNTITNKFKFIYIEMDRAESNHRFDKVEKYNDLYESNIYENEWWTKLTQRFPMILLVTTQEKRLRKIQEAIKEDNRNGLEFAPILLDTILKEVMEN